MKNGWKNPRPSPTWETLHEFFLVEEGKLIRKVTTAPNAVKGEEAGYVGSDGYRRVHLEGKVVLTHRVIFYMDNGYLPEVVDHIYGDTLDNTELRACSQQENSYNHGISRANKTGLTGVCWDKARLKWRSTIQVQGRWIQLGRYEDFFEACCARKSAEERYYGEFARHN